MEDCQAIAGDHFDAVVRWKNGTDLHEIEPAGPPVMRVELIERQFVRLSVHHAYGSAMPFSSYSKPRVTIAPGVLSTNVKSASGRSVLNRYATPTSWLALGRGFERIVGDRFPVGAFQVGLVAEDPLAM